MIFMKKQGLALTILIFSMLFVFYLSPSHVYSETSNPFVGTWGCTVLGHKAGSTSTWFNWKTDAGILTFNEDGTVTNTYRQGADTCPQNHCLASQTENFTYTYNPSTREAILNVIDDTVKFVLSDDGSVAIGNGITLQDQQLLIIAVKLDTQHTYSGADVSGSYFTAAYEYDSLGNPYPNGLGKYRLWSVVADAANGNFALNGYLNGDGTLLSVTGQTQPYQVSGFGYMLIGTAEEGYATGYVGNGKFTIFSNPPGGVATDFASFVSLKKQDRSYTQQDLAGTWAIATFGDYNGQEFNTHFGTITCNSTGSCSASLTQKTSTGAISNLSKSFNLSVSQDGSLNNFYLTNNTPHFSGAIGNDGNVMILLMNPNGSNTNERLIGVAVKRNSVQPSTNSDPGDLALNASVSESDNGWGGGSNKGEIVDGLRTYGSEWARGLAFTGGTGNWAGESCGWRQVTVDFGTPKTFNRVVVWHHGLEHVPNTYKIQYWDGSNWVDIFSTTNGRDYLKYPATEPKNWWEGWSTPTENTFQAVTASKVRFALNNCDITHGWIYEIEVYYDEVTTPYTITGIVKDVSENPIPSATIKVWDENNNLIKESQTDQSGSYTIGLSSAGSYTIGVYKEGYETINPPQIVYLNDSAPHTNINFIMESIKVLLNLTSGWNFISFPKLPANTSISTIMSGKDVRIIWAWDNVNQVWLKWKPLSSDNTLTNFEFGKGYWIYVNGQTTIDISNWNKPSSSTLTLRPGWNLVGWLGTDSKPISDALSSLANNWRVIWNWENGTWRVKHSDSNITLNLEPLNSLNQGKAYWIKVREGVNWQQQ